MTVSVQNRLKRDFEPRGSEQIVRPVTRISGPVANFPLLSPGVSNWQSQTTSYGDLKSTRKIPAIKCISVCLSCFCLVCSVKHCGSIRRRERLKRSAENIYMPVILYPIYCLSSKQTSWMPIFTWFSSRFVSFK